MVSSAAIVPHVELYLTQSSSLELSSVTLQFLLIDNFYINFQFYYRIIRIPFGVFSLSVFFKLIYFITIFLILLVTIRAPMRIKFDCAIINIYNSNMSTYYVNLSYNPFMSSFMLFSFDWMRDFSFIDQLVNAVCIQYLRDWLMACFQIVT